MCKGVKIVTSLLLFLCSTLPTLSQSLEFFDISYDEYPTIKALFKATDSQGTTLFDITKQDVQISENNTQSEVIYVKSPSKIVEPLSIIMVFDISGSMDGERMKIAKRAANTIVDLTDGKGYEIAITSFHSESFINSDFTSNSKRLKSIIGNLEGFGGTNYDSAFLQAQTGIFEIAQSALYKKIVIFMTDGQSTANIDSITNLALKDNITVYCTTIKLPMPEILKDLSKETGGYFYEQINDPEKAKQIYTDLFYEVASSELGIVKWKAAEICDREREATMKLRNMNAISNYSLQPYVENNLTVKPRSFFFDVGKEGKTISRSFLMKAQERPITIQKLTTDVPGIIRWDTTIFPITLNPGESSSIRLYYTQSDTNKTKANIYIETEDCIENTFIDLFFETRGKIEVTYPKGGEIFAIGTPVNITWKGVPKSQDVSLFYKNGEQPWQNIGNGRDLTHTWITPTDTGFHYQVKVQCLDAFEKAETQQLTEKYGYSQFYDLSSDGSLAAYKSRDGYIKVVHIESGEILKNYKAGNHNYLFFSNDNQKLITYYKNSFGIIDIFLKQGERFVTSGEQGFLFAAYTSNIGDEYLMPAKISPETFVDGQKKIIDYITMEMYFIPEQKVKLNYAAISNDKSNIFLLNQENELLYLGDKSKRVKKITQFAPGYKKIIISPQGEYALALYPQNMEVVQIKNGKTIISSNADFYIRFSPDGNKLLTYDTARFVNLWDLEKKKKILSVNQASNINFSPSGNLLHYGSNNVVYIYDIQKEKIILERAHTSSLVRISPDDKEFLSIYMAICWIYNISTGEQTNRITSRSYGGILDAFFDINGNVLVQSTAMLSLWEPQQTYEPGISNEFTIISPKPTVLKEINMGQVTVGESKEAMIKNFIKNETEFTIHILGAELDVDTNTFNIVSGNHEQNLAPGETSDLELSFQPIKTGITTVNINVFTLDTIFKCRVTGEGIEQQIDIPGKTINFGSHFLGTQKDSTFLALKNISSKTLHVSAIRNTSADVEQFQLKQQSGNISVLPGKAFFVDATYKALYEGKSSGIIEIHIDEIPQPVYINMFGKTIKPKNYVVRGKTLNSTDSVPIDAKVVITDLDTLVELHSLQSDKNGNYESVIKSANRLLLYAEKEGFISGSETILPSQFKNADTIYKNIYLTPLSEGSLFRLNGIFFEFGKATILASSENDLSRVIRLLASNPGISLEIHGHTDYVGSDESNLALSRARATSVERYLTEHGIDTNRLEIKYFGESQPIATNETDEGRQLNRRVEFRIR